MDQFRVPQRQVDVRVVFEGGEIADGKLHVPLAGPTGRTGRVFDRLIEPERRFVPFAGERRRGLVGLAGVLTIEVSAADGVHECPQDPAERELEIQLELSGGVRLSGRVAFTMPEGRSRLLDFLNAAPRFLPLRRDDGRVTFVNRDRIVRVIDFKAEFTEE